MPSGPPADARAAEDAPAREDAGDADDGTTTQSERASADPTRTERLRELAAIERAVGLDGIAAASAFDDLSILAPPTEGRFTDVYRTRARSGRSEAGIALHTFDRPAGSPRRFAGAVGEGLSSWNALTDHDLVVDLFDWGESPRPWMTTEYTTTLYDRIDVPVDEAVWNCRKLAETLAVAHERGVLHTGLDLYSVVYTDAVLEDRQQPLVAHFGLLDAVREYVDPSSYLDPRYAAPEYYDSSYGDVDHATDIYQLGGGGVIYTLVTGRPPTPESTRRSGRPSSLPRRRHRPRSTPTCPTGWGGSSGRQWPDRSSPDTSRQPSWRPTSARRGPGETVTVSLSPVVVPLPLQSVFARDPGLAFVFFIAFSLMVALGLRFGLYALWNQRTTDIEAQTSLWEYLVFVGVTAALYGLLGGIEAATAVLPGLSAVETPYRDGVFLGFLLLLGLTMRGIHRSDALTGGSGDGGSGAGQAVEAGFAVVVTGAAFGTGVLGTSVAFDAAEAIAGVTFGGYGLWYGRQQLQRSAVRGTTLDSLLRHLLPVVVFATLVLLVDAAIPLGLSVAVVRHIQVVFVIMTATSLMTAIIKLRQNVASF